MARRPPPLPIEMEGKISPGYLGPPFDYLLGRKSALFTFALQKFTDFRTKQVCMRADRLANSAYKVNLYTFLIFLFKGLSRRPA